jgi:hypothetical protein
VPDVSAAPNASAPPELFSEIRHAATPGPGGRVLRVLTALVLLAGATSTLRSTPFWRGLGGVAAAGDGAVPLVVTAAVAASETGDVYDYVDARWTAWVGRGDGPGVSGGLWLAALLVVAAGGIAVAALRRAGLGSAEDRIRAPGSD